MESAREMLKEVQNNAYVAKNKCYMNKASKILKKVKLFTPFNFVEKLD
ncbi:hypothetical protein [Wolbachia endosymbiont of Litomosoides sigmodontis]|nr:hypothetical protein [Wolbachia endosymbiont of Litomosoides sigmodontis]